MSAVSKVMNPTEDRPRGVWVFLVLAALLVLPSAVRAEYGPHGPNIQVSQPTAVPGLNDYCRSGPRSVTWSSSGFFAVGYWCQFFFGGNGIYFRKFDVDGNPIGNQVRVDSASASTEPPGIAADATGNLTLVWFEPDGDSSSIFGQRFDSTGNPAGTKFKVNETMGVGDAFPTISMRPNGSFVVSWRREDAATRQDIFLRIFSAVGVGGTETQVSEYRNDLEVPPQIAFFPSGTFAAVWQTSSHPADGDGFGVSIRHFDASGGYLSDELPVNTLISDLFQGEPAIAVDSDNRFIVTWTSLAALGGDDGLGDIRAQRFRPDGEPDETEFRINADPTGRQGASTVIYRSSHNFFVVYLQNGHEIVGQNFLASGVRDGLEIGISDQNGEMEHSNPHMTKLSGENSVVVFGTEGGGVAARVLGTVVNPVINLQPQSLTACSGSTATLTVSASGGVLTYQWLKNGQPLFDGPRVSGSQTNELTITDIDSADQGQYRVIVYEAPPTWGETRSAPATLTVSVVPTASVTGSAVICSGDDTTIQAALSGTGPWNLTWSDGFQQNNVQTSPATRNVSPGSTTTYSLTSVANATCPGTTSGDAVVTVRPLPTGVVSGSGTVCAGGSTNIQATLTGTAPWNVTWSDGFVQTANSSPAVRSVSPSWTTTYSVSSLTDATCTGSATGSATVTLSPTASVSGSRTICVGTNAQIQVILTGTAPWNLLWSDGFVQNGVNQNLATRTVSPAGTTVYTIVSVTDAVCSGVSQGDATISVSYPPTPATVGGPQTICARSATAALGGNTPTSGVGQWSVVSGGFGTFLPDALTPGARFQHTQGSGPVVLRWTITSAACNLSSSANVTITILPSPSTSIIAPESVCAGATGQTASVPQTPNTTYFWRVENGTLTSGQGTPDITFTAGVSGTTVLEVTSNNGTCFQTGSKYVEITQSALVPSAVKPLQGAANYSENSLQWTSEAHGTYRVLFDTVNPPQKILADGISGDSTATPVLFPSTTYYWRVIATNPCGTATSPVFFFVSGPCPWTITPPHTIEPAIGTLDVPPFTTLSWTAVPGVSHANIQISTSPITAQTPVFRTVMAPKTSVAVGLIPGTKYYWAVTSVPGCGSAVPSVSAESWFQTATTGFSLLSVAPSVHNRYSSTALTATGAGIGDGMSLLTILDGRSAGPFTFGSFTPTTVSGTLGPDTTAPAGKYDVGLTLWGNEVARIPAALSVRAFRDVTENDFYFISSSRIADAGIMESDISTGDGIPDFGPSMAVSRALMAEYLAKSYQWWRTRSTALPAASCVPVGTGSLDFPDVPCGHPQWLAIHWIKTWGVTTGAPCDQGLCFLPASTLTRGEMVTFLERLKQGSLLQNYLVTIGEKDPGCEENWPACVGWTDPEMQTAGWPRREVNVGFADRMTSGCAGTVGNGLTMCVMNPLTRGEIAEFLGRAIGLVPTP